VVTEGTLQVANTLAVHGTLTIDGGAVDMGTFSPASFTQLNFIAGSLSLTGDLTVGTGDLLGPNPTIAANQDVHPTGMTTIDSAGTLTIDGGTIRVMFCAQNAADLIKQSWLSWVE